MTATALTIQGIPTLPTRPAAGDPAAPYYGALETILRRINERQGALNNDAIDWDEAMKLFNAPPQHVASPGGSTPPSVTIPASGTNQPPMGPPQNYPGPMAFPSSLKPKDPPRTPYPLPVGTDEFDDD